MGMVENGTDLERHDDWVSRKTAQQRRWNPSCSSSTASLDDSLVETDVTFLSRLPVCAD